jgi:hypothetical protein
MKFDFEYFENLSGKFKVHYNMTGITGILHEDLLTFMIIFPTILLRIRNVSDKHCRENQNTHFMFKTFFPKIVLLKDNVEKYGIAGQATNENTIWRMRIACWITKATDIHSEYVIIIAFTLQQWLS